MQNFIPFDFADKQILIAYFNDEQVDELRNFALAFFHINPNTVFQVSLVDIGYTGFALSILQQATITSHFLPFAQPIIQRDDLQQQYILLMQQSAKILGKASIELKKRRFILREKHAVTPHIYRLVLQSEQDLSHLPAGYAFLFNTPILDYNQPRAVRYYTLRKAWQQTNARGETDNLAWIDIYCHGEKNGDISLGEKWVKSLTIGDVITSEREFPEKIDHLDKEQTLLIADETSLPTVARLLETWKNPLPPMMITFLQNPAEQTYLNEYLLNEECSKKPPAILTLLADQQITPEIHIMTSFTNYLAINPIKIGKVWGGLEANCTKTLRPLLLDYLKLTRDRMVLKVYWRET